MAVQQLHTPPPPWQFLRPVWPQTDLKTRALPFGVLLEDDPEIQVSFWGIDCLIRYQTTDSSKLGRALGLQGPWGRWECRTPGDYYLFAK